MGFQPPTGEPSDPAVAFLGDNISVDDRVGYGRIPAVVYFEL